MESAELRRRLSTHLKFTEHARRAMLDDDLDVDDVVYAVEHDEIIERYPDAKPFPSCLLYGRTKDGRQLHVVCALPAHVDILIIITVYIPSEREWIDFKRRRRL